jgi:hypothetical protein
MMNLRVTTNIRCEIISLHHFITVSCCIVLCYHIVFYGPQVVSSYHAVLYCVVCSLNRSSYRIVMSCCPHGVSSYRIVLNRVVESYRIVSNCLIWSSSRFVISYCIILNLIVLVYQSSILHILPL